MPSVCPTCGAEVSEGLRFCPSCRGFLAWDAEQAVVGAYPAAVAPGSAGQDTHPGQPSGPPSAAPPPEPGPLPDPAASGAPPSRGSNRPVLRWTGEELGVEPGDTVEAEIEVATSGTLVDEIQLSLSGPAASFGVVSPTTVRLYPGTSQPVTVRFSPPHGPATQAGSHAWVLHAVSPIYGGAARTVAGVVEVGAFAAGVAELEPAKTEGRSRTFAHRVVLSNSGNVPWTALLRAETPAAVQVSDPERQVTIEPGGRAEVELPARSRRRWIGSALSHELKVRVDPVGGPAPPATTLLGSRIQRALIPVWVPPVLLALVALAIAAYAVFGGSDVTVPAVAGKSGTEAVAVLEQADFEVTESVVADDRVAPGVAIGTDPAAGSQVDSGAAVTLLLSAGPVAGQIAVPSVVGLTQAEAKSRIEGEGLTSRVLVTASADQEAGTVTRTVPDGGVSVPAEFEVAVYVSSGSPTVTVPDLVGWAQDDAVSRLDTLGLKAEVTSEASDTVDSGTVLRTDPPADSTVAAGESVTLVVSSGPDSPPNQAVTVPEVTNDDQDQAQSDLRALGLVVAVEEEASDTVESGKAIGTTPEAGTELTSGDDVTLRVSTGPATTDDPASLLGLAVGDPVVAGYLAAHGGSADGTDTTLDNGVELLLDPAGTVAAVTAAPTFAGQLPADLSWTQDVDSVTSLLGTATSLANTGPSGELVGVWDVDLGSVRQVVVMFDPASGTPTAITLGGGVPIPTPLPTS